MPSFRPVSGRPPTAWAANFAALPLQLRLGRFRAILGLRDADMSRTISTGLAERVITILRAHEAELRGATERSRSSLPHAEYHRTDTEPETESCREKC
jgi:hypothetical protein